MLRGGKLDESISRFHGAFSLLGRPLKCKSVGRTSRGVV